MEFIKPLRNYLRPFNCVSVLQAIWHLSNHLEFNRPLPPYLAAANPDGLRDSLALGFFLWELDTLAREVVLHCEPRFGKTVTGWGQMAKAINLLKRTEQDGSTVDEHTVMSEMSRIAHRQFHWQQFLAPDAAVTVQLRKLAKAIGQVYATLRDALAGGYPHWKPDGRPVHPLLVTLDNWNLFTHTTHGELFELVRAELDRRGIDHAIVAQHQYVICSANELELAIQVMHQVGIHAVIEPLTREEKLGWQFSGHLRQSFARELTSVGLLFPEERRPLLPRPPAGA